SSGLIVPFASTTLDLSAVGISFSMGWANSSPAVISMPSSDMALCDDQDVLFGRLDDRRRLAQRRLRPALGTVEADDVVPHRLRHLVAQVARVQGEVVLRLRLAPAPRRVIVGALLVVVLVA